MESLQDLVSEYLASQATSIPETKSLGQGKTSIEPDAPQQEQLDVPNFASGPREDSLPVPEGALRGHEELVLPEPGAVDQESLSIYVPSDIDLNPQSPFVPTDIPPVQVQGLMSSEYTGIEEQFLGDDVYFLGYRDAY